MQNFNTNSNNTNSTFSHFGKNKLLFAENSLFVTKSCNPNTFTRKGRTFVSNIQIKKSNGKWEPLYWISNFETIHQWNIYSYNEKKIKEYDSLLKAVSAARQEYLNLHFEEGEYRVAEKSFIAMHYIKVTPLIKLGRTDGKDICVDTYFEEMPDENKLPKKITSYKPEEIHEFNLASELPV